MCGGPVVDGCLIKKAVKYDLITPLQVTLLSNVNRSTVLRSIGDVIECRTLLM